MLHPATTSPSASPFYIATVIPDELLQLHDRLEERTRQLEQKSRRLNGKETAASPGVKKRGRKPRQLDNPLQGFLRSCFDASDTTDSYRGYPLWLDDVLQGIARLDWYRANERSIPLSVKTLVRILDTLPTLSSASIGAMLLIEERQARRYLKAAELALPFLLKGMPDSLKQRLQDTSAEEDEPWSEEDRDFDALFNDQQAA